MVTTEEKYFLDLEIPTGTEFPNSVTIPEETVGVRIIKIRHLLNWIDTKKLIPYPHNRGLARVSSATSKDVRTDFSIDSWGELSYGWYDSGNGIQLTIATGHSRIYGLIQRLIDGNLTEEELNEEFSIRCVKDFMKAYKKSGGNGQNHKSADKVLNPDLTYGGPIYQLKELLNPDIAERLNGYSTPLSSMMEFCHFELENPNLAEEDYNRNSRWDQVYNNGRGSARHKSNEEVGDLTLLHVSRSQLNRLAVAITDWYHLTVMVKALAGNTNVNFIYKAGFFGMFVMERYAGKENMFSDNLLIAKRIVHKPDKLTEPTTELCKNNDKIYNAMEAIFKAFKAKCSLKDVPALVELNRQHVAELKRMRTTLKVA
jgi:hypothetical protein